MKRKTILSVTFVLMLLYVSFWGSAEEVGNKPLTVSPGSETEVTEVWQSCPTFSWSAVDQAASYRIAVFETVEPIVTPYENMAAKISPVISKDIPGPALSWTLSSAESLKSGSMYVWYVQAVDGAGNSLGLWSGGRIFKVEQEIRFAGVEEKLAEKLRDYGVNEETITNVLKDIKAEVKEVVVRDGSVGNKNPPSLGGLKAYEGSANTFFGLYAGGSITSGCDNTFIGESTGHNTNTGYNNAFVGQSAGYSNTTGYSNTCLGKSAGYSNNTGIENNFIGSFAGYKNTTGANNIFIGNSAGYSNISGHSNTFLGNEAGFGNTEGSENTFIGRGTGAANTTGSANTFIGRSAGAVNSTGIANTLLGYAAGNGNTTGSSNTFIGYESGKANISGNNNAFIGYKAGKVNTYGNQNLFVGNFAGCNKTTGFNNTFLGHWTGFSNKSGVCNVFLGFCAGYNETGSNKLYIADSDTSSPLIYGEFDNSLLKINGNLRVTGYLSLDNGATQINSTELNLLNGITSISTGSVDNDKLVTKGYVDENDDVGGGLTGSDMTDRYICKWDGVNTRLVNSLISESPGVIKIGGNLGIGTSTPLGALEIEKTGVNTTLVFERTDGAQGKLTARAGEIYIGSGTNHRVQVIANNSVVMTLTPTKYVGIGTPTPIYPLHMLSGAYCSKGGTWTNASSKELKENIVGLSKYEALDALKKLNPVKYNYKIDKTDKHVGFIAEDAPELVATSDRKGMSPMDVVAVLTKVVQEQQTIIINLQERLAKIEKTK